MDLVFFCRDALNDSIIGTLSYAVSAKKAGKEVEVVFTGEALDCLCSGLLGWSPSLAGIEARKTVSKEAKSMGLPVASPSDPREIDVRPFLLHARQSGVLLWACPVWSQLLSLKGRLPEWIGEIKMEKLIDDMISSKNIIGTL